MSRATNRRRYEGGDSGRPLSPLPSHGGSVAPLTRWGLALLIALYLAAAGVHSLWVPVGQTGYQNAPDEAAHVNFVRILVQGRLPTQQDDAADPKRQSYEWHQPPLYYLLAAPLYRFGVHGMRIVSIVCGLIALLLIYRIATLLFPEKPEVALLSVGIAALTSGHIAVTSTVNNDALLEVCYSATLLSLILILRSGITPRRAVILGIAISAALLTKATGILLIPVVLFAFFLLRRSDEAPQDLIRGLGVAAVMVLILSGWWYARNALLYHELLPLHAFQASFEGTAQAADVAAGHGPPLLTPGWPGYWLLVAQWTFQSFWAVYGTPLAAMAGIPRFLPPQVYLLLAGAAIGSLVGLARLHFRRKEEFTETQLQAIHLLFLTILLVGGAFALFLTHYFQTQGRYLYPAMAPICIATALGWRSLFPDRYKGIACGFLVVFLGVTTVLFLLKFQAAVH